MFLTRVARKVNPHLPALLLQIKQALLRNTAYIVLLPRQSFIA